MASPMLENSVIMVKLFPNSSNETILLFCSSIISVIDVVVFIVVAVVGEKVARLMFMLMLKVEYLARIHKPKIFQRVVIITVLKIKNCYAFLMKSCSFH